MQSDEHSAFMSEGRRVAKRQGGGGLEEGLEAGTYNLSSLFVVAFRTAHQGSRRISQQKGRGGGEERDQDEKKEEAIAARVHVLYIAERGKPVRVGLEEEVNDSSSLCSSLSSHVPLVGLIHAHR
eukprot:evm.model.NODE_14087_length_57995_cov_43.650368.4